MHGEMSRYPAHCPRSVAEPSDLSIWGFAGTAEEIKLLRRSEVV